MSTQAPPAAVGAPPVTAVKSPPPPRTTPAGFAVRGAATAVLVAGYYAMLGGVMRAVRLDVDNVLEKGMLDRERLGKPKLRKRH